VVWPEKIQVTKVGVASEEDKRGDAAEWAGWAMAGTQNFGWVGHNAFGPTSNWPNSHDN